MSEWGVELFWRCTVCDRENRACDEACENCTAPKKKSDALYTPGSTGYDDQGAVKKAARAPSSPAIQAPAIDEIPFSYRKPIPAPARTMDDPTPISRFPWRRVLVVGGFVLAAALLYLLACGVGGVP